MQDRDLDLSERPNRLPWPPTIYTGAFALAWLLQEIAPIKAVDALLAAIPMSIGLLAAGLGFGLDLAAMRELARSRTAIMPNVGATVLVSGGVFAFTRNPIYLGPDHAGGVCDCAALGLAGDRRAAHDGRRNAPCDRARGGASRAALRRRRRAYAARARRWL